MKCKDIADKYKVHHLHVGKRRKQFFPDHTGGDLSPKEQEVLIDYYESLGESGNRKSIEKSVQPEYITGCVCYVPKKKGKANEVLCKIRDEDGNITGPVECLIPVTKNPHLLLRQNIKMQVITADVNRNGKIIKDVKLYRHESLSKIAWPRKYTG